MTSHAFKSTILDYTILLYSDENCLEAVLCTFLVSIIMVNIYFTFLFVHM